MSKTIVGIYAGKFQPPHKGNLNAYNALKEISGENTFVAANGKVEVPDSPLTFVEKQQIWARHGVPADHVVQVPDPDNEVDFLRKFDPHQTSIVFCVSNKDSESLKNNPMYAPYTKDASDLEPFSKKRYYMAFDDDVVYPKVNSVALKEILGSDKPDNIKQKFFEKSFGWYDISIYNNLAEKFKKQPIADDYSHVKEAIFDILAELDHNKERKSHEIKRDQENERSKSSKVKDATDRVKKAKDALNMAKRSGVPDTEKEEENEKAALNYLDASKKELSAAKQISAATKSSN